MPAASIRSIQCSVVSAAKLRSSDSMSSSRSREPRRPRAEAFLGQQVGTLQQPARLLPQLLIRRAHDEVAVRGLHRLVRRASSI